eukprot:COSAG01_NODE_1140_length_11537_cov_73.353995_11_plen_228_part_00
MEAACASGGSGDEDTPSSSEEDDDIFGPQKKQPAVKAGQTRGNRAPVPATRVTVGTCANMGGKLDTVATVPEVDYDTDWEEARTALLGAVAHVTSKEQYGAYNQDAVELFWVSWSNKGTAYWSRPGGALHCLASQADLDAAIQDATAGSGGVGGKARSDCTDKGGLHIAAQLPVVKRVKKKPTTQGGGSAKRWSLPRWWWWAAGSGAQQWWAAAVVVVGGARRRRRV